MRARIIVVVVLVLIFLTAISACRRKDQTPGTTRQLHVVTTLFPLYDFTKNIVDDKAVVTLLLPPGVEAHSFEPKAGDVLKVNTADLFIFTGKSMEPWADGFLKGVDNKNLLIVDASEGISLVEDEHHRDGHGHDRKGKSAADRDHHRDGKVDPHIWLDLSNAQRMVNTILVALVSRDPRNRDLYTKNADAYLAKLADLDRRYQESLSRCGKRTFIHGGHSAFSYLARRYNLEYVSAYAGSPDAEPSPRQIITLKKKIQEKNLKAVYHEELIVPRVAEVLSRETGAKILKLHGAHNIGRDEFQAGVSFLSIMEANLKSLQEGLECQP